MNLEVLIPSLFLPEPIAKLFPVPSARALAKLLGRGDRRTESHASSTAWLCEHWGIRPPYPVASIFAAFDGLDSESQGWLFAEPVNMSSQSKNLELFPARFLELTTDEARQLVDALNAHFSALGLMFFAPTNSRWYVRCAQEEIPETTPVDSARIGSMLEYQPKSRGKINWRAIQNEIQMLFHSHQVNSAREAIGKPLVNGVWFWGNGIEPRKMQSPGYDAVLAENPLPIQLSRMSQITVDSLALPVLKAGNRNVLAVIETCMNLCRDLDMLKWVAEVERLDREWFYPITKAIQGGDVDKLTLFSPDGEQTRVFTINRRQLATRFWRKPVPL